MTHLDTSFLVDLLRGRKPARAVLDDLTDEEVEVSVHAVCELFAGVALARAGSAEEAKVKRLLRSVAVACPDERFPVVYGTLLAALSAEGRRIATMDLRVATAAVVAGADA